MVLAFEDDFLDITPEALSINWTSLKEMFLLCERHCQENVKISKRWDKVFAQE